MSGGAPKPLIKRDLDKNEFNMWHIFLWIERKGREEGHHSDGFSMGTIPSLLEYQN